MILFAFLETFTFSVDIKSHMALVDIQIPLLRAAHGFPRAVDWYKPWMVKILSTIYLHFS